MDGGLAEGLRRSPQLPEAIGSLGAKTPVTRCWGSEDKALSDLRQGGSRGGVPSAERFLLIFNKNNEFLCIFRAE